MSRPQPAPALLAFALAFAFHVSAQEPVRTGNPPLFLTNLSNAPGIVLLQMRSWPATTNLTLPTPTSNWIAAYAMAGHRRVPLAWRFNTDATQIQLELPAGSPNDFSGRVYLESVERTTQFPDGRIVFSALDAAVHGRAAKLESHPGNHRIGFWTNPGDSVSWNYKPTRWGRYDLELVYSADGTQAVELELEAAGKKFTVLRPPTGSWYRYQVLSVGRLYLAKAEPFRVVVSCPTLRGGAALNLKAVILRPAPEGQPVQQETSGAVTLAARDAITHSTVMRYEPATNKNCLGFWVNARDWAEWEFNMTTPRTFEVEVWQGCGKGNGGSEAVVEVAEKRFTWTVEDTGHFQNFVPRRVGRVRLATPGTYSLAVRALRKQGAAVMDIRQVRLVPVEAE